VTGRFIHIPILRREDSRKEHKWCYGLGCEYDKSGRVTKLTDVSGKTIEYTYDILGRLTNVINEGRKTAQYEYNPDNTISRILYGSGVFANMTMTWIKR